MKTRFSVSVFLLSFFAGQLFGQGRIELQNPSFESDDTGKGVVPSGWINLGAEDMTPPDIQPGFWNVNFMPQAGDRYLGLVVRDNNTCEGVGQRLDGVLKQGATYEFSVWLARSSVYKTGSPLSNGAELNFTAPTILKIWGYNTTTNTEELLALSESVSIDEWIQYTFVIMPQMDDYDEIDLMACYAPGHAGENGNLLIDNCSAIVKVEK